MRGKEEAVKSAWEEAQTSLLFLRQGLCGESCLKSFEAVRKILRAFYRRDDTFFVNEHSLIEMCLFLPDELRERVYKEVVFLEKYRWLENFPFIRELLGGEPDADEARRARDSAFKVLEIFTKSLRDAS